MIPLNRVGVSACLTCCLMLVGASRPSFRSSAGCAVRGVWELVSTTSNGKDQPLNGHRQIKIVTDRHWIWLGQDAKRDTLPLKTEADTLRQNFVSGGEGTYTTTGNIYVEHVELFNDPSWSGGRPWTATCRVEGKRWYHSFPIPQDSTGVARDSIAHFVEVWQKIE